MQAENCEQQARAIEDELVGGWPNDEEQPPSDDPSDDTQEEPDELKAFKAQLKLMIGETI